MRLELEIASAAAGQSRLLRRDLAAEMLTPQAPGGFGLGTAVRASAGRRQFGHDGANVGYNCFAYAWPEAGAAVAVMANMDNAREVLGSILAAAEHRYAPSAEPAAFLAPRDVIGRYLLRNDFPIEVAAVGGRLTFAAPGQPPAALIPLGGHGRYRLPGLDCEITFRRENDQLYTMEIKQERQRRDRNTQPLTRRARPPAASPRSPHRPSRLKAAAAARTSAHSRDPRVRRVRWLRSGLTCGYAVCKCFPGGGKELHTK